MDTCVIPKFFATQMSSYHAAMKLSFFKSCKHWAIFLLVMRPSFFQNGHMFHSQILDYSIWAVFLLQWGHLLFFKLMNTLSCFLAGDEAVFLSKLTHVSFLNFRLLNLSCFLDVMRLSFFKVLPEHMCLPQLLDYAIWAAYLLQCVKPSFYQSDGNMSHSQILGYSIWAVILL